MPGIWYRTGTVDVTNGSKDVIGSGTLWLDPKVGAQPGNMIFMPDGEPYEVAYVITDTKIILATVYGGSSATAQPYAIVTPLVGSIPALASKVASTLAFAQGQYESLDAWAYGGDDEDVEITNPNNGETTVVPSLAKLSKMTEKVGDALPAAIRAEAAEQLALQHKNAAAGSAQQAAGSAASVGADADRASAAALSAESSKTAVDAAAVQVASDKNAAAQAASTATTKAAEAVATEQRVLSAAESQISAVTAQGDAQVLRVEGTGDTQVARVTTQGGTQDSRVVAQGNTQVSLVAAEGNMQVAAATAQAQASEASAVRSEAAAQRAEDLVDQATGGSLLKDQNLADVPDKSAARTNLGVMSSAQVSGAISAATQNAVDKTQNLADLPNKADALSNINGASATLVSPLLPAGSATFTYDGGVLVSMAEALPDGDRNTAFTYDQGRLTEAVEVFKGKTRTTTYTYQAGILTGLNVSETAS